MKQSKTLYKIANENIKLLSWNVHGLVKKVDNNYVSKLDSSYFQNLLKNDYSIIGLCETWLNDDSIQQCDLMGYQKVVSVRKCTNKKAKRPSGGIIVYFKNEIKPGIVVEHSSHDDMIWLRLKKDFFQCEKDIYVCFAYLAPANSSSNSNDTNLMDFLERDITKFSKSGHILLAGDLNSRTGAGCKDHIVNDSTDYLDLPESYTVQNMNMKSRFSQDKIVNNYGEWLNDTCINSHLCIVNGRVTGDTLGRMTYFGPNGASVVDYFIITDKEFSKINYMKVEPLGEISDHCPITLSYKISNCKEFNINSQHGKVKNTLDPPLPIYKWTSESKALFQRNLNLNQLKLDQLLDNTYPSDESGIEQFVDEFTSQLNELVKPCVSIIRPKIKRKNRFSRKNNFFDMECKTMKSELSYKLSMMTKYPHCREYREDYYKFRRVYRKLIKRKQNETKENILKQLESLKNSNPKAYWSLLDKLKNNKESQGNDMDHVTPQEWYQYFKNQSFKKDQSSLFSDLLANKENEHMGKNILDYPISDKEIHTALSRLMNDKSPGDDLILGESLKYGRYYLTPILLKIYNQCLNLHYFPSSWNSGLITPIHKKGPKSDPSNFRKICLTSILGKLLTSILQKRLITSLKDGSLDKQLNENQAGFIPKYRTSDNIFILSQIIEMAKKEKKPLFMAFIDLKMAFDMVNHQALLAKLLDFGIGGNFYLLIKSIYFSKMSPNNNTNNLENCQENNYRQLDAALKLRVKLPEGMTSTFPCNIGVKQGDPLSPILFNCFFDSVIDHLQLGCKHGFNIQNKQINSLLYADDLVIFSFSKTEMQNNLKKLEKYCNKWKLIVNVTKSQIVTINYEKDPKFTYSGNTLKHVSQYTYLGVVISKNGLQTSGHELALKAQKAWFGLKNILYSQNIRSVNLTLHLFDCCIKPILLYASEVWSSTLSKSNILNFRLKTENILLKCCRWTLGLSRNSSNLGILGELGKLPMSYYIHLNTIKYWAHISSLPSHRLVKQMYEYSKETKSNWYKFLTESLKSINMNPTNINFSDEKSKTVFLKKVELQLRKRFTEKWKDKIKLSSNPRFQPKLRTYITFKDEFKMENYLEKVNSFEIRRMFSKLRLSDHCLEIEQGRRKNTPSDLRFCKQCDDNKIEDEFHFVIECKKFSNLRNIFFQKLSSLNDEFLNLNAKDQFIYIMSCNSHAETILSFIKSCYSIRHTS